MSRRSAERRSDAAMTARSGIHSCPRKARDKWQVASGKSLDARMCCESQIETQLQLDLELWQLIATRSATRIGKASEFAERELKSTACSAYLGKSAVRVDPHRSPAHTAGAKTAFMNQI